MEESIFTKIIKGELPGEIIYEDDQAVVLMTIDPITPGHCLVVPREQIDSLWDVDDGLYQHLMEITKLMVKRVDAAYDYKRVGMFVEGFGVPHAHIHVIGYIQPLEPSVAEHINNRHILSNEELAIEANKLRAI